MGNIREILAKVELPPPELGWNEEEESFCLPFSVELRENIHIHWQDIRIEMDTADFDDFAQAIHRAHSLWVEDGKPETLEQTKWYGAWPGEEELDFKRDRHIRKDRFGRLRHHYRLFPRTEMGELHYDAILQIEIQRYNWFHIHYKNFRWEIGPQSFLTVAGAFAAAARRYRRMEPLWSGQCVLEEGIRRGRRFSSDSFIGKVKRWLFGKKH
jgi:hypothetical protein